jgi:hypothetical protein
LRGAQEIFLLAADFPASVNGKLAKVTALVLIPFRNVMDTGYIAVDALWARQ